MSIPTLKFTVVYERKVKSGDYESLTVGLWKEYLRDGAQQAKMEQDAFSDVRGTVDRWVEEALSGQFQSAAELAKSEVKTLASGVQKPEAVKPPVQEQVKQFRDLDKLPWKSFRAKGADGKSADAAPTEGGWLFSNNPLAVDLYEALKQEPLTLKIGDTEFDLRISAGQGSFIQRSPVKDRQYGKPRYGF